MTSNKECVRCPHGRREPGQVTMTLERDETTLVIKEVPADVCDVCGESYLESNVVDRLQEQMDQAIKQGSEVDVRHYVAKTPKAA